MSKKIVTIIDVKNYVGQEVTIGAWVANKSGKGKIAFLQLRDGSAFFQGVAFKPNFIEKFGEEEVMSWTSQTSKSSVSQTTIQLRRKNMERISSWTTVTCGCVLVSKWL